MHAVRSRINLPVILAVITLCLSALPVAARQDGSRVEIGEIIGAPFRIEIPPNWNQALVMYCHGYEVAGSPRGNWESAGAKALRDVFLSRGFAVAQSAYSAQGWAVKEGVEDTEALRRYFVAKYGRPRETYVTGHSMGGVITLATLERYPEVYDGGLPLCGPLAPALDFFESRVFDMLVVFEYLFPGTIGDPVNFPADAKFSPSGSEKVRTALASSPEKAALFARHYNFATVTEIPGVLGFFYEIVRELKGRAGGNAFDNRNTIYEGFGDDAAVNRGVKRYAADPKAREYLRQHYTPTGRIADPVLTIQTTYDQLVSARDVCAYGVTAQIAGTQDQFAAQFVVARGHCNFTPAQTGAAFDSLLAWVREHKRPAPGELR